MFIFAVLFFQFQYCIIGFIGKLYCSERAFWLDPVALDQACVDLVYASDDPGKADLIKRIESRNGVHTVEAAAEIGVGSREYELIEL